MVLEDHRALEASVLPEAAAWARFDALSLRLGDYLKNSEVEFARLIKALVAYGDIELKVKAAGARLTESAGAAGDSRIASAVQSMREAYEIFRGFLDGIAQLHLELGSAATETQTLIQASDRLQRTMAPFRYIVLQMRLEAARVVPGEREALLKFHGEMQSVLARIESAGESQQTIFETILSQLSAASHSVEQTSASYAARASESEHRIQHSLEVLSDVPEDVLAMQGKMMAVREVVAYELSEEVKILQAHDAIRQRTEHILQAMQAIRRGDANHPAERLVLQREQAKSVRAAVAETGNCVVRALDSVILSAQQIAGDGCNVVPKAGELEGFEAAVDDLAKLAAEVGELLREEAEVGQVILELIHPVQALLSTSSQELEGLALAMKRLALNILVGGGNMKSALGIDVLGSLTSKASESVLELSTELNRQFAGVAETLQDQVDAIAADVRGVETCRSRMLARLPDTALRNSRRAAYDEVNRLSLQASPFEDKTRALMQSLGFADEGTELFGQFDDLVQSLLSLYPEPDRPFQLDAATAGYTTREEYSIHAMLLGSPEPGPEADAPRDAFARLTEPAEGDDYGDNVELF